MQEETVYSSFSERAQEVAPQIESLLNGLTVKEAASLLFEISRQVSEKTKVKV